ncbi:hypothetical protein [Pandoraea sp. NPDC087047]|uniref:hypothetical protein n=1 Tax=Pandoraea sp. NPDC087047 TaxID=3364390 RepID=UPI0037F683D6
MSPSCLLAPPAIDAASITTSLGVPSTPLATTPPWADDWQVEFTGVLQMSMTPHEALPALPMLAAGTSGSRPACAAKRDFSCAFGNAVLAESAAQWKRHAALREIPALEPTPSTSDAMPPARTSIPAHVLRKVLLDFGNSDARTSDPLRSLASRTIETALDSGPYADARHLLQGLIRQLETEQALTQWTTVFEHVVARTQRFESRIEDVARSLLLTHDATSGASAQALAQASTNASIDRLVAHRLHAIADMPEETRATAWSDLLGSAKRVNACANAERMTSLAQFIRQLPQAEQVPAALALVTACGDLQPPGGWEPVAQKLLDAVPPSGIAAVARAIVDPGRRLRSESMKAVVDVISDRLTRIPRSDAVPLVRRLVEIVVMRGAFDHLSFSPDQCAHMLDDLRWMCRRAGLNDLAGEVHGTLEEVCDEYKATLMQ